MDDKIGSHQVRKSGVGHEFAYETKPYEFGDSFNLNIERTVRNAVARQGTGTPVSLTPDDFEIERSELLSRASTVLMLDLSLSMPMRDNFLPAKKVTMALALADLHAVPARPTWASWASPSRPTS